MADEIRGIEKPGDIKSRGDALRLLDIDETADSEDINDAVQGITLESHPDARGTEELFKAVQLAEDALTGEALIDPDGGRAAQGDPQGINISIVGPVGPTDEPTGRQQPQGADFGTEREPGEREAGPFGGFGAQGSRRGEGVGFRDVDPEGLIDEVENLLRDNLTEGELKERYGDIATFRNVAEVITTQILQGTITLGDLGNVIGTSTFTGTTEAATGGFFTDNPGGPFGFGSSDFFSSDRRDVTYSPGNTGDDDDDEDSGS